MQVVFALSVKGHSTTAQTQTKGDELKTQPVVIMCVCVCVLDGRIIDLCLCTDEHVFTHLTVLS